MPPGRRSSSRKGAPLCRVRSWWHSAAPREATFTFVRLPCWDRAGGLAGSRVRARASAVVGPARPSRPALSEMRKGSGCWDARPPHRGRLDAWAVDWSNPSSEASGAIARAGTEVHGRLFDCASDLEDRLYCASCWDDRQLPGFVSLTGACAETSACRPRRSEDATWRRQTSVLAGRPGGAPPDASGGRRGRSLC